jgi:hypothetical protein
MSNADPLEKIRDALRSLSSASPKPTTWMSDVNFATVWLRDESNAELLIRVDWGG